MILSLERVSTDAIIYVNGTKCGGISWPAGDVEISEAVKPGEDAVLCVLVSATTEGTNRTFLDPGRVVNRAAALESRGLIGDVILSSRPKGAHVSDIFVQTSTRKKELKLEVEVAGVAAAGPVQFEARVFDRGGNEVKRKAPRPGSTERRRKRYLSRGPGKTRRSGTSASPTSTRCG